MCSLLSFLYLSTFKMKIRQCMYILVIYKSCSYTLTREKNYTLLCFFPGAKFTARILYWYFYLFIYLGRVLLTHSSRPTMKWIPFRVMRRHPLSFQAVLFAFCCFHTLLQQCVKETYSLMKKWKVLINLFLSSQDKYSLE